jgi:hypothetical protein
MVAETHLYERKRGETVCAEVEDEVGMSKSEGAEVQLKDVLPSVMYPARWHCRLRRSQPGSDWIWLTASFVQ